MSRVIKKKLNDIKRNLKRWFFILKIVAIAGFFLLSWLRPALAIDGIMNGKTITGETDNFLFWLQTYDPATSPYFFDKFFIDKAGNVGIGTTNPTIKLDVNGAFRSTSATISTIGSGLIMADSSGNLYSTSTSVATGIPNPTTNGQTLRANGTNWVANSLLFNDGTNIGIGTTNPVKKLQITDSLNSTNPRSADASLFIYNSDATANNLASIGFNTAYNGSGNQPIAKIAAQTTGSGSKLYFMTSNSYSSLTNTALTIDQNGNVGIGTTNPNAQLNIASTATSTLSLESSSAISGAFTGLLKFQANSENYSWAGIAGVKESIYTDQNSLAFYTTAGGNAPAAERMRIKNNGYVGIDTTNPGVKLDVNGAFRSTSATVSTIGAGIIMADSSGNLFSTSTSVASGIPSPAGISGQTLRSNGTNWVANNILFNNGANIGIGTTAPIYPLQVAGDIGLVSGDIQMSGDNRGIITGYDNMTFTSDVDNNSSGDLFVFKGNGSTAYLTINNSGNVGIGTTNPLGKLHVWQNDGNALVSKLENPYSSSYVSQQWINNSGFSEIWRNASARNDGSSENLSFNIYNSNGPISFWTNGTRYMDIRNDGKVGIGTTNPGANLDVSGRTVKFSNLYTTYSLHFGGAQDLNWKTIANVIIGTGSYAGAEFEVNILDTNNNYGSGVNSIPMKYFVRMTRSAGVQDDQNDADVSGPVADYVRVVKTATGVYELQVRQIRDWSYMEVTAKVVSTNVSSGDSLVYVDSPINGSTSGTIYNATSGNVNYFTGGYFAGNVGIGTTNPTVKLDVNGAFRSTSATISTIGAGLIMADSSGNLFSTSTSVATGIPSPSGISGQTLRSNGTNWVANSLLFNDGTNVGIGNTNPAKKLDVGDGASQNTIRSFSGGVNKAAVFSLFNSGNREGFIAQTTGNLYFGNSGGTVYTDAALAAAANMTINTSGNVGIGTTGPGKLLEIMQTGVTNGLQLRLSTGASTYWDLGRDETTGNFRITNVSLAETKFMIDQSSGYVGIGTTAPGVRLDVNGAFRSTSATISTIGSGLIMADSSGNLYSTSTSVATGIPSPSGISGQTLRSNGTNWVANSLLFNDGANIGIGTTAPTEPLAVKSLYDDVFSLAGGNIGSRFMFRNGWNGSEDYLNIRNSNQSVPNGLTVTGTGNIGIGTTSPLALFNVHAGTNINFGVRNNASKIDLYAVNDANSLFQDLWLNGGTVSILASGNVGIGTTTSGYKLEVNGTTRLGGQITTSLSGTGSRCLHVDANGVMGVMAGDCGTSTGGDNLGSHIATQNIQLGNYWLSGDGGNEGVFVKSDGNVGIGTSAPIGALHISGASGVGEVIQASSYVAGATANLFFKATGDVADSYKKGAIIFERSATGDGIGAMHFALNNVNSTANVTVANARMTILEGGSVGINTTNPGVKLDVNGALRSTSATISTIGAGIIMADSSGNLFSTSTSVATGIPSPSGISGQTLRSNGTSWVANSLLFNDGTNVGIGTTNPVTSLDIATGTLHGIAVGTGAYPSWMGNNGIYAAGAIYAIGGYAMGDWSGLGIGDSTAGIVGTSGGTSGFISFRTNNIGNFKVNGLGQVGIGGTMNVYDSTLTGAAMAILGNGNVGVGTTNPGVRLDVNGAFRSTSATVSTIGAGLIMADSSGNLYSTSTSIATGIPSPSGISGQTLRSNGTNWVANNLLFNDGTNVGIGTTNPSYALDVNGNARANSVFIGKDIASNTYPGIWLNVATPDTTNYAFLYAGGTIFNSPSGTDIFFRIGNVNQIKLNDTGGLSVGKTFYGSDPGSNNVIIEGNVGIGTTSPVYKLEVNGTTRLGGQITTSLSGTGSRCLHVDANGVMGVMAGDCGTSTGGDNLGSHIATQNIQLGNYWLSGDGGNEGVFVKSDGNVGIGTTNPGVRLDVNGAFRSTSATISTIGAGLIMADSSGNLFSTSTSVATGIPSPSGISGQTLRSNGTNWVANSLLFNDGTNIGIGTTAPAVPLDVVRDPSLSGFLDPLVKFEAAGGENGNNRAWSVTLGGTEVSAARADGGIYGRYLGTVDNSTAAFVQASGNPGSNVAGLDFSSSASIGWSSTAAWYNSPDTGISRYGAGVVAIGNGTPGNYSGTLIAGNVGIGTTTPNTSLVVNTGLASDDNGISIFTGATYNDPSLKIGRNNGAADVFRFSVMGAGGSGYLSMYGSGGATSGITLEGGGNVGVGTNYPGVKLDVNGSFSATSATISTIGAGIIMADSSGNLYSSSTLAMSGLTLSGDLNMSGHDIKNVNKLTVVTIDPLYNLKGVNYSTYAPSISGGVKEEYVGKVVINSRNPKNKNEYEKIINFSVEPVGSDLWVWRNVVDYNFENVEVIMTPYGNFANAYYLIENNQLIFRSDKPVTLSYRLIGNRFDWRKWPTRAIDQSEPGMKVE